ncbi:hypothetical protein P3T31_000663 [Rhizobium sp. AN70]|nr:hypothetical protein [Rhizobium sp. AN70]
MSVVKRSTATNKVVRCSRRHGERVSEQTGNDKRARNCFRALFAALNSCPPKGVSLSAVAGDGKLTENARHFLLHVTIRCGAGNGW